jgi:hypothetical protein
MIFAIEYKVVFLDYENITRDKKYLKSIDSDLIYV